MVSEAKLVELLRRHAERGRAELFTSLPAKVKAYTSSTQTADLEIVVRPPLVDDEEEADVEHEELPIIPNVRVVMMSAGDVGVTMPIPVGTEGLFVVSSLQTGEFRRTGKTSDAVDVRRNSLGCGGWFFPCKLSDGQPIDHAATNALVLEAPEIRIGKNAVEAIAKEPPLSEWIELLLVALATGSNSSGTVTFATPLPAAPSFAATKGKVE